MNQFPWILTTVMTLVQTICLTVVVSSVQSLIQHVSDARWLGYVQYDPDFHADVSNHDVQHYIQSNQSEGRYT